METSAPRVQASADGCAIGVVSCIDFPGKDSDLT